MSHCGIYDDPGTWGFLAASLFPLSSCPSPCSCCASRLDKAVTSSCDSLSLFYPDIYSFSKQKEI